MSYVIPFSMTKCPDIEVRMIPAVLVSLAGGFFSEHAYAWAEGRAASIFGEPRQQPLP